MKVLVIHRDTGSRRLLARLTAALPDLEWLEWMAGEGEPPLDGVDAVLGVGHITRDLMERGTFGFVQTVGTGYDNIDVPAATDLGIWVAHIPAYQTGNAESVAEHAVLLMLALARRLPQALENLRAGRWAQPTGLALLGKRACLVGLGAVGDALAARLLAFGMEVSATREHPEKGGPDRVQVLPASALGEAVQDADFVIVCARATSENQNLIGASILSRMKSSAILVNIARGSLVDEHALLHALQTGRLGGAGLDVFDAEPANPANPLFALDNVIATPHIAGVTEINMRKTLELLARNFRQYADGTKPHFVVNQRRHPRSSSNFR